MINALETINQALFLSINATPNTSNALIAFAIFCAKYTMLIIPLTLCILWFMGGSRGHRAALRSLMTMLIALALGAICSKLYFYPRPFMIPLGNSFLAHAPNASFPSTHATIFFSISLSLLWAGARVTGSAILFIALFVAWARVFLGVHFPLDMVGGVIVAFLACLVMRPVWRLWGETLTSFCEIISARYLYWLPKGLTP